MQFLTQSRSDTAWNLALDEWLLTTCDRRETPHQVLRLWENQQHAVILGRSSRYQEELNLTFCSRQQIDFLRRTSGGAAVVIGPGCLMYALIIDYRIAPGLRLLDQAHQYVMERMQRAIHQCGIDVEFQGTCDLTLEGRKFSGNSLRCQRNAMLYHGTILYDFDLDLLHRCLATPPRQPEYRRGRSHRDFVTNLPVNPTALQQALVQVWQADSPGLEVDESAVQQLVDSRYRDHDWNQQR